MREVRCKDLVKRYGSRTVLHGLDLHVPAGSFTVFHGPTGIGKTTLLRLIAGLDKPNEGRIEIGGRAMVARGVFVAAQRRRVGMVFQDLALWPHLRVGQHLRFVLRGRKLGWGERERRIREMLALVGLAGRARAFPSQLTGGEQQRLALARALCIRPDVLLLDEPLANLDQALRARLLAEILRLRDHFEMTLIFVSHHPEDIAPVADQVLAFNSL